MKKLRISAVIFLFVSTLIFGVFVVIERINSDTKPPVISYEGETLIVSVGADEKELLADVTAKDDRSGDVTDTLVVESMSSMLEDNTRIISYAAIDQHRNVARKDRIVQYSDYTGPVFSMSKPLRFPVGSDMDVFSCIHASSDLDGNLDSQIKYTLSDGYNFKEPGYYSIEFSVMDSAENVVYLPTFIELYEPRQEGAQVALTDYLVYIPLNSTFDAESYYNGTAEDDSLSVETDVDTTVPGVYYADYYVSSGVSRLVVVVTES